MDDSMGTGAQAAVATGQAYGMQQDSTILNALSYAPALTVSMGYNANRVKNTILGGGYNDKAWVRKAARKGRVDGMFRNNNILRPRTWGRLSNVENIHGTDGKYTPLQVLARAGNWGAGKFAASEKNAARVAKLAEQGVDLKNNPFQSGAYGQFSAASKLARTDLSSKRGAKKLTSTLSYIDRVDSGLGKSVGIFSDINKGTMFNGREGSRTLSSLTTMTGNSGMTLRAGGYMSSVMGNATTDARLIAANSGKTAWLKGAERGAAHLAYGGQNVGSPLVKGIVKGFSTAANSGVQGAVGKFALAKGVQAAGMAVPGLNVLLAAKWAYDIGQMGASMVKGAANFAVDGVKSFKGTIDKPIMGMGFRDNEVAATSRARGVEAIQNSRLNARSALGSEAGRVHAHFG